MINGDNKTLEVSSVKTKKLLLKIQKKGDFGISCFDMQSEFIVYSDNVDTQILQFNQTSLSITKLTKKICVKNGIDAIQPAKWIHIFQDDFSEDKKVFKIMMITKDLKVLTIDLSNFEISEVMDLNAAVQSKLNATETKFRKYDQIFNLVSLNQNMIVINFLNQDMFYMFELGTE